MNRVTVRETESINIYNERVEVTDECSKTLDRTEPTQTDKFGQSGQWKVIFKSWDNDEGWMKSTKALEIPGYGCLVQVTTQQGGRVAEALEGVPGVKLTPNDDGTYRLIGGVPV